MIADAHHGRGCGSTAFVVATTRASHALPSRALHPLVHYPLMHYPLDLTHPLI